MVAMWGQRCGLDITATTAMPEAVRIGFARSLHSAHTRPLRPAVLKQTSSAAGEQVAGRGSALRQQRRLVLLRHGRDDLDQLRWLVQRPPERRLRPRRPRLCEAAATGVPGEQRRAMQAHLLFYNVQVDVLPRLDALHQGGDNLGDCLDPGLRHGASRRLREPAEAASAASPACLSAMAVNWGSGACRLGRHVGYLGAVLPPAARRGRAGRHVRCSQSIGAQRRAERALLGLAGANCTPRSLLQSQAFDESEFLLCAGEPALN